MGVKSDAENGVGYICVGLTLMGKLVNGTHHGATAVHEGLAIRQFFKITELYQSEGLCFCPTLA